MRSNPMERRLATLSDQWGRVRDSTKVRLLCWQLTDAETRVFDAFIEVESDQRIAEHPTLFVSLDTAFVSPQQHALSLSQQLEDGLADGEAELRALDLPNGWKRPPSRRDESPAAYLVRACESFLSFFDVRGEVALILRPRAIADAASYEGWLLELANAATTRVRVIVLDDVSAPAFPQLATSRSERITCVRANLDLGSALQELSDAAGQLDTPGGQFRDRFVRMSNALMAGELEQAVCHADAAVLVAEANALWHLSVPVHIALASAFLARGRSAEALLRYAAAELAAETGSASGDAALADTCRKLELQSRLAHGAGLAGLREWSKAAALFERILQLSAAASDAAIVLDCRRLASFCYEQAGDTGRAWQLATAALEHARELEPSERERGNFASLADALRRMAATRPADAVRPVLERLERLNRAHAAKGVETNAPRL